MGGHRQILFIEDMESDFILLNRLLKKNGIEVRSNRVENEKGLKMALEAEHYDLVISDNGMPSFNAAEALKLVRGHDPDLPFILVSGSIGEEEAVGLMKSGANDYILKDNIRRLPAAVNREINDYQKRKIQRENDKKLVISQLRYQHLTESIDDVFFALDDQLQVSYWNWAAAKEFGDGIELGISLDRYFPEWFEEEAGEAIKFAIGHGRSKSFKLRINKAGKEEYYEGKALPSNRGVSVLIRNVTQQYQDKAKLEAVNQELETLLYRIAHDLKGPVASMKGLVGIANHDHNIDEILPMLMSRVNHLQEVLGSLLELSKMRFGDDRYVWFNLYDLIGGLVDQISISHRGKDMRFVLDIDPQLQIYDNRLSHLSIWQNLIGNAVKYGDIEGAQLEVTISIQRKGGTLVGYVRDNGPGISPDVSHRVFDMFFRGNTKSDGSGLGLYLVKNAVDNLHGNISLAENKRVGTQFNLTIPINTEQTKQQGYGRDEA